MNEDSMSEREPQAMTLGPGGSRKGEVILGVVVSIRGPRKSRTEGRSDDGIRDNRALSSCIGNA